MLLRLDVSKSANFGHSNRSQLWVGTPTNEVIFSRSISSRARSGSHLYIITSLYPAAAHDSSTATPPVTWNSGTIRMYAGGLPLWSCSSGRRTWSTTARQPKPSRAWMIDRWVDTAPFGRPVVPDV